MKKNPNPIKQNFPSFEEALQQTQQFNQGFELMMQFIPELEQELGTTKHLY